MPERRSCYTPGGACSLSLHLVWCPKYRRRVLGGRVPRRLDELLGQFAGEHGLRIVAGEVMSDHVLWFVQVGLADAPAPAVRASKGRTARIPHEAVPYLRNDAKVLWAPLYFAAWVGYVSETMVRRYFEHQLDAVPAS